METVTHWVPLAAMMPMAALPARAGDKPVPPPPPRADVPDERPLSPENARRLLEWDWLYQADGKGMREPCDGPILRTNARKRGRAGVRHRGEVS